MLFLEKYLRYQKGIAMDDPSTNHTGAKNDQPTVVRNTNASGPELARSVDLLLVTYAAYLIGLVTLLGGIVGIVIAYLKRPEVVGTWRESHYTWLIRTFWIGLLFAVIGFATMWILIGFVIFFAIYVWFIIRLIKGWMAYSNEQPIRNPEDWFFG